MRRVLVVDDDLHTRLAIGIWLKQCGFRVAITDGGESGLAANDGTFDLMIVDVFKPNMRGFESIRAFSQPRTDRPADCDLRLRFSRPRNGRSRLLQDGAQPRRDTVPAQAVPAGNAAGRNRRVSVGSRTASQTCRSARRHWERAAEHFEREGKYGLNCHGEAMRCSQLSSALRRRRKPPAPPTKPEKPDSPIMIATAE